MHKTLINLVQKAKKFIFDFDGVLADSEFFQLQIWQEIIDEFKLPKDNIHISLIAGLDDRDAIENLVDGFSNDAYQQLVEEKQKRCAARAAEVQPVAGMQQFLEAMKADKNFYICSNSYAREIVPLIKKFYSGIEFIHILGKGDFARGKPHPDPYLKLLQIAQLQPDSCLVFEDSLAGIRAAKSAGLQVIYVDRYGIPIADTPACTDLSALLIH